MHSKVIVASLVCMLAASFGAGNRITSDIKKANYKPESNVCLAPNDDGGSISFVNQITSAEDECRAIFTCGDTINSVRVIKSTSGVTANSMIVGEDARLFISTRNTSKANQAILFAFNVGMKARTSRTIRKTIYIHYENGVCCYSALSYSDAKTMYFMNYVATADQLAELANGSPVFEGESSGYDLPDDPFDPDPGHPDWPPIPDPDPWPPIPNPPRVGKSSVRAGRFDLGDFDLILDPFTPSAEQTYIDYIFGDTQDMTFTVDLVSNEGLQPWQQRVGTGLNAQVNWYDENSIMRPAEGVSVQFYANGEVLTDFGHIFSQQPMSYDYRTGSTGYCNVDVMSDARLNVLEARICADSLSTRVEDRFNIDYPFFARATDSLFSLPISDYAEITFTINIYQKKSERGKAFAISQMQNIPFDYADEFTPTGVTAVETEFPAAKTFYDGEDDKIFVQEEDYKSWDVLTHEYGHHIADSLNLCYVPDERMAHNVYQDLTIAYGDSIGKQLAYAEGLATYLGLASQMYYAGEFSSIDFADEIYRDGLRNVEANYNEYFLKADDNKKAESIEACVTGAMIKLLDDVNREYDNVALGHTAMWNAIKTSGRCYTAGGLFLKIAEQNPEYLSGINQLLDRERFAEIPSQPVEPQEPEADWTVLFYTCSTCQATYSRDITEPPVPDNINYVSQGGSGGNVVRKHKVGSEEIIDEELPPNSVVGDGELFKEFITWGLSTFPAKKTAVVITNHGRGYLGCCIDDNYTEDVLTNHEVRDAFEYAFAETNTTDKLEFICYSACLMQVQDIAEFNAPFFKYQIASEEEMIDSLIPNHWIVDLFNNEDTLDILESMVNCFIEFDGYQPAAGQCISVLNLSYMEEYKNTFEELASKITTIDNFRQLFDEAVFRTKHFGNGAWLGGMGPRAYGLIDALDLLDQLSSLTDENGVPVEDVDNPFLSLTNDMGESLIEKTRALIRQIVLMERSYGGSSGTEEYACAYGFSAHIYYSLGDEGTSYLAEDTSFYNWRHLFVGDN